MRAARLKALCIGLPALAAAAAPADAGGRVLQPMDLVSIRILAAPELSESVRVAPDGTVAFPYVGRIRAAGLTEDALAASIERRLVERKFSPTADGLEAGGGGEGS